MKERPILFSAPMVRALLDGSKTQTRSICKPAATLSEVVGIQDPSEFGQSPLHVPGSGWFGDAEGETEPFFCPYGKRGDRLWVREAFRFRGDVHPRELTNALVWYEAQDELPFHTTEFGKLRPSIHMPRWASRITLEITDVRVDRLQDISADDCYAEGAAEWAAENAERLLGDGGKYRNIIQAYKGLWESINGPGSWERNEWVWVVEFKVVKP